MSTEKLEYRLAQIRDQKLASEVRRVLLNLSTLFDGHPPPHIQTCMNEILDLLEEKDIIHHLF